MAYADIMAKVRIPTEKTRDMCVRSKFQQYCCIITHHTGSPDTFDFSVNGSQSCHDEEDDDEEEVKSFEVSIFLRLYHDVKHREPFLGRRDVFTLL